MVHEMTFRDGKAPELPLFGQRRAILSAFACPSRHATTMAPSTMRIAGECLYREDSTMFSSASSTVLLFRNGGVMCQVTESCNLARLSCTKAERQLTMCTVPAAS